MRQATLEEVVEADLLVHVMDAASPALAQQRATVLDVLRGCGPVRCLFRAPDRVVCLERNRCIQLGRVPRRLQHRCTTCARPPNISARLFTTLHRGGGIGW